MGGLLLLACMAGTVYFAAKGFKALQWHASGAAEREGRAEYGRIRREQPDSADGRLSEAEFLNSFVKSRAGGKRYMLYALLFTFVGWPIAGVIMVLN